MWNVKVTDEDIREGKQKDCYQCPVALAIKRCCPELVEEFPKLMVDTYSITRKVQGRHGSFSVVIANLPDYVSDAIEHFDKYNEMEPFEFELRLLREA